MNDVKSWVMLATISPFLIVQLAIVQKASILSRLRQGKPFAFCKA